MERNVALYFFTMWKKRLHEETDLFLKIHMYELSARLVPRKQVIVLELQ